MDAHLHNLRTVLDLRSLKDRRLALTAETNKLAANIAAERVRDAPMRTLLPEICSIIFAYCVEDACALRCISPDRHLDTVAPLVISRVCRRWRALAINNPTLWTKIHIHPLNMDARCIHLFLERSSNLPLHIAICPDFLRNAGRDSRDLMASLLRQFFPYFHRIESFKTRMPFEILPSLVGVVGTVRLPFLKELELLVDDPHNGVSSFGELYVPRLEHLRARDITLLYQVLGTSLRTITSLTIADSPAWKYPQIFPYLLASCVQLQTCKITFPSSLFFSSVDPIELPELVALTLEWPYLFDPMPLFRALRAPKLRTLHLTHQTRKLILPQHTLAALRGLVQSAPGLHELTVEGCNLPMPAEARALLAECRALESLSIVRCQRGERFLAALTPAPDSGAAAAWLCPRLTHVALSELQDADVVPIVLFVRARTDREASPPPHGARYLQELALHTEMYNLTRHARLLMLSGLLDIRRAVDIVGPFRALFDAQQGHSYPLATVYG